MELPCTPMHILMSDLMDCLINYVFNQFIGALRLTAFAGKALQRLAVNLE